MRDQSSLTPLIRCGYVQVPGYIIDWKFKTDKNGSAITRVEAITDKDTIKELRRSIADEEGVLQSMISFE